MDEKLGLKTPWMRYANRVKRLFEDDPEVRVDFDNDAKVLTLLVTGDDKAMCLEALLPSELEFGSMTMAITVKPSNADLTEADMFRKAFANNPLFVDVEEGYGPAHDVSYALFMPDAVQVEEDDISQYCGVTTTTAAELVKSVLGQTDTLVSSALLYD